MVGEHGDVLCTSRLNLQHEGLHGGISTKGERLLWWKTLLLQLDVVVKDVSWELFEERFRKRYLSQEFIERQLNEFNAIRQGGCTVLEYEAHFIELLRCAPHLNTEKLKVNRFVFGP
jgi:hypothetical protein